MTEHKPYLAPLDIAKLLKISSAKVLAWIRRGDLKGINVGNGVCRPRYRVSHEDFDLFLADREVVPPSIRSPRQCRVSDGGPLDPELGEQLLKKNQAVKVLGTYYRVHKGTILFY